MSRFLSTAIFLSFVLSFLLPSDGLAGRVHPVPQEADEASLTRLLPGIGFELPDEEEEEGWTWSVSFYAGGEVRILEPDCTMLNCKGGVGDWLVKGSTIYATAAEKEWQRDDPQCVCSMDGMGPCASHCFPVGRKIQQVLKGNLTTSTGLVIIPAAKSVSLCSKPGSCKFVRPIRLIPGHSDRALFEKVRARMEPDSFYNHKKYDIMGHFHAILGPQVKKARKVSEIWYAEDEKLARNLADRLKDLIGKVEVKKWEWGGFAELIVIVGQGNADQVPALDLSQVRVKLMDGFCHKGQQLECHNPLLKTIDTQLKTSGCKRVGNDKAKNKRERMEVWFKGAMKEAAQALVKSQLGKWVKVEDIKEWKWAGDFDVLVIVPEK